MNLLIEIEGITVYLIYSWYFVKVNYISLAWAWSNELVYWASIFIISFIYCEAEDGRQNNGLLDAAVIFSHGCYNKK